MTTKTGDLRMPTSMYTPGTHPTNCINMVSSYDDTKTAYRLRLVMTSDQSKSSKSLNNTTLTHNGAITLIKAQKSIVGLG